MRSTLARPIRFNLRTLLLATLLVAVALVVLRSQPVQRFRATSSAKEGGFVWFQRQIGEQPNWTDAYVGAVTRIDFPSTRPAHDSDLRFVTALQKLSELNLPSAKITDSTLNGFNELTELQRLHLGGTDVSDAGVKELDGLQHLHTLVLYYTNITDRSMPTIAGLPRLVALTVAGTNITDQGVALLAKAQPSKLATLDLSGTLATDACVDDLSQISSLRLLIVDNGTEITPKAIATLLQRCPNLRVRRNPTSTPTRELYEDRTTP